MPSRSAAYALVYYTSQQQPNSKGFHNDLNWTIWYVFSVSTFTCCNETQWVAKIKCLLLTRQQHDWYTALNISIFYKKGGKDRSGLRAESNGWTRKENYFQVKNFYVRKPSLRIAGFVTSKYESSILTLKITWLQHTFDSGQPKTNLLSQLFWSKGKAISKYKDRLYFLVNFQIDFAQLYRARMKIIFSPRSTNHCSQLSCPRADWVLYFCLNCFSSSSSFDCHRVGIEHRIHLLAHRGKSQAYVRTSKKGFLYTRNKQYDTSCFQL